MLAQDVLSFLTEMTPVKTADLPRDQIGIYGLIDHSRELRYIGSTSAADENFRKRIHQRHRTGSETHSHYFSKIYNCGRMWRNRLTQQRDPDAKIAKDLRSAFIAEYCRAVYFPIVGKKGDIEKLEAEVIRAASREYVMWNRSTNLVYPEPVELVDALMDQLGFNDFHREAVERQRHRFESIRSFRRT